MDAAMADGTRSGSVTDASGTNQVPSGNRSTQSPARASDSRVLPVPPGPVSVSSRVRSSSATAPSTSARPTNVVSWGGRLLGVRSSVLSAGNEVSRPSASTWYKPLGSGEVLEPVLAEVEKGDPSADLARDDARGIREDDLAAVGSRRDTRRAVHLDAHVVARDDQDLAGVDAHAHPDVTAVPRMDGEGLLGGDGRADGPGGCWEGDEDGVALGSERHAALCGGGPGHDVPVRAEGLAVGRVADVGEQAGRALDVGEQKGDDAFRQGPGHAGSRRVVRSSNSTSPRAYRTPSLIGNAAPSAP